VVILTPIQRETVLDFYCVISQLLNVSTFGNMADVYAVVHLVPHPCQHFTVYRIYYFCLLAANQGNYVRGLFSKNNFRVSLCVAVRITMIHCVVCCEFLKCFADL
jgi:hypothetical protein